MCATGVRLCILRCDAADAIDVQRLLASIDPAQVGGVWHAAGVLSDAMLAKQSAVGVRFVSGPKVGGVSALHRGLVGSPLHACVFFSSVSTFCGLL